MKQFLTFDIMNTSVNFSSFFNIFLQYLKRKRRGDLIETLKIINGISNYGWHFFNISTQTGNLLSRQIWKIKSTNQLDFFANWVIYSWKKLSNQIKNSKNVKNFKIKLDDFWKKKLRGHFWELLDELLNRIWPVYRYCINSIYILC